jgi:hypothetical protein
MPAPVLPDHPVEGLERVHGLQDGRDPPHSRVDLYRLSTHSAGHRQPAVQMTDVNTTDKRVRRLAMATVSCVNLVMKEVDRCKYHRQESA